MNSNTIKHLFFTGLLSLALTAPAGAQTILDGKARVSNLSLSRNDDKLFVSMDIDVAGLDLKTNSETLLTPRLAEGGDTLALPSVLVAGRNRYFHHLRNDRPGAATPALYRLGDVATIAYRTVVPYAEWMNDAELAIGGLTCGCCGEPEATHPLAPLARLDFAPKPFIPDFVYVRPKAEPKINVIEGSAYVDFPVNRTEIHENYRRNPIELQKILSTIDAVKSDADTRITAVTIKGYASPEGSYANNTRLAKGRTETLKEYVRRQYDFAPEILRTDYEPEDWAGLERFVEQSQLGHRTEILALIRSTMEPDAKDRKIRSDYPEEYAFLLREVYPALRHSDYAVTYEVRAYTDIDEIRRLLRSAPQKLSLEEMYMAAQQMEVGSDEYDETFEIAVRMFPDDATANLNAASSAMRRGDMKNAERYLAKAGDAPEAVYARAVLAALAEDFATARTLFGQAARAGIAQADEALAQLDELKK